MTIEVFKTSIQSEEHANEILKMLMLSFPGYRMNFDLDDCDKIFRVAGNGIDVSKIIETFHSLGFYCEVLL